MKHYKISFYVDLGEDPPDWILYAIENQLQENEEITYFQVEEFLNKPEFRQ
jgi:hypothetical protein